VSLRIVEGGLPLAAHHWDDAPDESWYHTIHAETPDHLTVWNRAVAGASTGCLSRGK
jgi:hypothetical protein